MSKLGIVDKDGEFDPIKELKDFTFDVFYDNTPPPLEFQLTATGYAANYFRNAIAVGQMFQLSGIEFEDSLIVTFTEMREVKHE